MAAEAGEKLCAVTSLRGSSLADRLGKFFAELNEPPFRLAQLTHWIYRRYAGDFASITEFPHQLRGALARSFTVHSLQSKEVVRAADGSCKYVFTTQEGYPVESVVLPAPDGVTFCLSSASGCPFDCTFCASGTFFHRMLRAGEIMDQYLLLRGLSARSSSFSGIVLMGMGEPLAAWDSLRGFLEDLRGLCGVGSRRVTVSTVGLPERIVALGRSFPQVKLAVSLHAAEDSLRKELLPRAHHISLAALREACRQYAACTGGRRITFEYVLLGGVNDSPACAAQLGRYLAGLPACVNLILLNPFPGVPFKPSSPQAVRRFRAQLRSCFRGEVTLRKSFGHTIGAACGQLGASYARKRPCS